MAATRDLVVQVTADVTGLQSGMSKAGQSLSVMEKQAREAERQIKKIGEAGAGFQRLVNDFAGVAQAQTGAARASADAFQEFARLQDAVDDLRGSLDPAFAATKRYEGALATLDGALAKGVISADYHAASVRALDAGMAGATKGAGNFANSARMVSQQLSQVGQQTMASGNFVQALAIQLPDLGLAFGAVGAAAGLAAGVALPLVMSAFGATADKAKVAKDAIDASGQAMAAMQTAAQAASQPMADLAAKYGLAAQQARVFLNTIADAKAMDAMDAVQAEISAIADSMGLLYATNKAQPSGFATGMAVDLGLVRDTAKEVQSAIDAVASAKGLENQEAAAARLHSVLLKVYGTVEAMPKQMRDMASQTAGASEKALQLRNPIERAADAMARLVGYEPGSDFLSAAIAQAGTLWDKLEGAVAAKLRLRTEAAAGPTPTQNLASQYAAYGVGAYAMRDATNPLYNPPAAPGGGSGGGGGGGADPLIAQVDALRQSFASQSQIELDAYTTQQEQLQAALDAKKITMEEFHSWSEQAQAAHQAKMNEIDVWQYGDGAAKASAFFGDMASIMEAGGDKSLKIAKSFGAAQAIVNAWTGASEALKLPFPGNLMAFGKVLATGWSAVNAIRGAGRGGASSGGSAGASSSASASSSQSRGPMQVTLTGLNASDMFSGSILTSLLGKLNAEAGDNGYTILVPK